MTRIKLAPVAGFVRIGTGRDAADVAFATIIGDATLLDKSVWVTNTSGLTSTPSLAEASESGGSIALPSDRDASNSSRNSTSNSK